MTLPLKRRATLVTACYDAGELPLITLDLVEPGAGRLTKGNTPRALMPDAGAALVAPGDVLFGKLRPYLAKSTLVSEPSYASTELLAIRPDRCLEPRFLSYMVQARPFIEWTVATSEGTKMPRTSWEKVGSFQMADLAMARQRAVVDFLDTETARIDALISKKRRLRELSIERFRSLVSETVGSGETVEVRRTIGLRTSGPRGWAERVGDVGAPFIRSQNLRRDGIELDLIAAARVDPPDSQEAVRSRTSLGDVLVGITGANTGWVGIIREDSAGGYVSQHVAVLRPNGVLPEWLAYSLFAHQAQDQLLGGQYGGTKAQLGLEDLAELRINVPSRPEQDARVAHLTDAVIATRRIESVLCSQLALLQEHRQALVTAVVTGELDMPGVAA